MVRAFLALDSFPEEWDTVTKRWPPQPISRVPTEDEIRIILAPWRPIRWRNAAAQLWKKRDDHAVWLRTHYGEGSDVQFRAWRDVDEENDPHFDEEETAWLVFDDPQVFNVGDDWRRALDVVPELANPGYRDRTTAPAIREQMKEEIRARVADGEDAEAVAIWEAEYGVYGDELQLQNVASYLLVADARAWETESLRLLLLDRNGHIVRHTTVEVDSAWESSGYWIAGKFRDTWWWLFNFEGDLGGYGVSAKLGDAYRARGEQGRLVYGLNL